MLLSLDPVKISTGVKNCCEKSDETLRQKFGMDGVSWGREEGEVNQLTFHVMIDVLFNH